jgi:hypothetical protein
MTLRKAKEEAQMTDFRGLRMPRRGGGCLRWLLILAGCSLALAVLIGLRLR